MSDPRIKAVLGPTNTGKTHFAIERMLGHRSGMIGFPLRLLARENYDRICAIKGPHATALITGEERILPREARYFVCTVEAMPLGRAVAFLAVDEIQLIGDPDRGHIFTERLLHARGAHETVFLGSETARPLIRALVPDVSFVTRERMSTLTYTGAKKLTRLPRRSAIVTFSATDVYGMAELLRRQRGGTAVVLGALSPRARNAQVGMYQEGEVDYLVATDAIGMGLNLDLDHVAFARLRKYDGQRVRNLGASELGQIAGRAGRHVNDGTFGTTADQGGIDAELVSRVEEHRFEPVKRAYWRASELDFSSPPDLLRSLEARPGDAVLRRKKDADDHLALAALARDPEIASRATAASRVRLLWDICQVPDFRKVMSDSHLRLLGNLYVTITAGDGRLPSDWVAGQLARLDRTEGDIDTLTARLAHVRTWAYIAHREEWLRDPETWRERARAIEDALSDALHDRLTQRFVDKRSARLIQRLSEDEPLLSAVTRSGHVLVEGHSVGALEGFRFLPAADLSESGRKPVMSAARHALRTEIPNRLRRCCAEDDDAFRLTDTGTVLWRDAKVARLQAGSDILTPRVVALDKDLLSDSQRRHLERRLSDWLARSLDRRLGPLLRLRDAARIEPGPEAAAWRAAEHSEFQPRDSKSDRMKHRRNLSGAARGLIFQIWEALGSMPRAAAAEQVRALSRADKAGLRRLGVRLGTHHIWLPALLKPDAVRARGLLWSLVTERPALEPLDGQRVSMAVEKDRGAAYYVACGYVVAGPRAIRVDKLEALWRALETAGAAGPFAPAAEHAALIACPKLDFEAVLTGLGFERAPGGAPAGQARAAAEEVDTAPALFRLSRATLRAQRHRDGQTKRSRVRAAARVADSPFGMLRQLTAPG